LSSPAPVHPARQRPIGLILAAIVLALMTCYGLLAGATIAFIAFASRTPQTAKYPIVMAIELAMGGISLLISGFCAATAVGLFRIQRWARYGILILGGLLAIFSALFAIGSIAFAFSSFLANPPTTTSNAPPFNPAVIKTIFLGMGGFFLIVSLIGIWWLVYFNLRRIRALFDPNRYPVLDQPLSLDPQFSVAINAQPKRTSVVGCWSSVSPCFTSSAWSPRLEWRGCISRSSCWGLSFAASGLLFLPSHLPP